MTFEEFQGSRRVLSNLGDVLFGEDFEEFEGCPGIIYCNGAMAVHELKGQWRAVGGVNALSRQYNSLDEIERLLYQWYARASK